MRTTNASRRSSFGIAAGILTLLLLASFSFAQPAQLSLADLLIGLRSKKVSLPERNAILTEAVKQRGVTFALSADIEKELRATGAENLLIDAIKEKGTVIKIAAAVPPEPVQDFAFFQKRADASFGKGEFPQALADFDKAIELQSDKPALFIGRGRTRMAMKSYDFAVADLDKAIALDPNSSFAYFLRGAANEKLGDKAKAKADYAAALERDKANEAARASLKAIEDEEAKELAQKKPEPEPVKPAPPVVAQPVRPEAVALGNLTPSDATRMVAPIYPPIARRSAIEGRVTVALKLDDKGNVTEAVATNGPSLLRDAAEDAARRSKFKPATFNGQPINATGSIVYNFVIKE
jgi:TonB family protein